MIEQYFKNILKTFKAGDTTEPSFYGDLKKFLEDFSNSKSITLNITTQPKRIIAGIPDFVIRRGKELIGYVEAKDIGKDLENFEYTEQIKKYKKDFDNFILTNYFDFWLWRKKEKKWVMKTSISVGPLISLKAGQTPVLKNEKVFLNLLSAFLNFNIPERKSAKLLAQELAIKAKLIPQYIIDELNNNIETEINRIYSAFQKYLISDLSKEDFADIYAQTITYGLFMACLQYKKKGFNRFIAQKHLPKTIKILRDTFSLISGPNLPDSINWIVDDIATILAYADIEKIKKELHQKTGGDDPLIHFYETFLKEYNPKEKKHRGVYYTPLPVVSYITRSINILLKEKFGKKEGFADKSVTILDPASGTLTFPANAIRIAKEEIDKSPNAGSWLQVVKNHILKDYYAFELLMAPYIIGHLKISLLLEDLGYQLGNDDRFPLYLTNTLDLSEVEQATMPFTAGLSEEAEKARKVKKDIPILVVMGNPPYSVSSSNIIKKDSALYKLYESYKEKVRKEEKNIQPLSDDYIKFISFAHWKIKQAGQGIVGMITNNSYLDGLIHRDMREKLAEDFDEIYILNLHGNLKRNEKTPEGGKDENVFDIQQGVGIILLVKKEGLEKKISYCDLYGLREEKYKFLEEYDIKNTKWRELKLKEPNFFFIQKDTKGEKLYEKFISVKQIFNNFNRCIVTSRDDFIISEKKDDLKRRIDMFANSNLSDEFVKDGLNIKDGKSWKIADARKKIIQEGIKEDLFMEYLYRPFDKRFIYYEGVLLERARKEIMKNMFKKNIAFLFMRQVYWDKFYSHFLITDSLTDSRVFISNRGAADIFPLYLYNEDELETIISGQEKLNISGVQHTLRTKKDRIPNINKELLINLETALNKKISPEDIFNYIYAVFYSSIYRKKYSEFLKIDFPKTPFTKNRELFNKVADLGKELVNLHLLKSKKTNKLSAKFPVSTGDILTDGKVEKREYNQKEKRIYINDKQYFEGIESEIWDYYIGGYQVLDKWLKDRKKLSLEDVNHYLKVITAIRHTIDLQKEIDKLYPKIEKSLI